MMSRRQFIAGNWKMFKSVQEATTYIDTLKTKLRAEQLAQIDVALCIQYLALPAAVRGLEGVQIDVGAQDVYWEAEGAFTGEISPQMLSDAGVDYVIIGHSERRQFFGETDETVRRKTTAVLAAGLKPIVCIGERL
jgi:triosephosphate isomerase (TIM)